MKKIFKNKGPEGFYKHISDFKLELFLNWWFADSILIWFASMHAIPAVLLNYLFNKPLFIIAGGWDVANVPEMLPVEVKVPSTVSAPLANVNRSVSDV